MEFMRGLQLTNKNTLKNGLLTLAKVFTIVSIKLQETLKPLRYF